MTFHLAEVAGPASIVSSNLGAGTAIRWDAAEGCTGTTAMKRWPTNSGRGTGGDLCPASPMIDLASVLHYAFRGCNSVFRDRCADEYATRRPHSPESGVRWQENGLQKQWGEGQVGNVGSMHWNDRLGFAAPQRALRKKETADGQDSLVMKAVP